MKKLKVLDKNVGLKIFYVVNPQSVSNHKSELQECLSQFTFITNQITDKWILLKLVIFAKFDSVDDFERIRIIIDEVIYDHFDDDIYYIVVPQSPADGFNIAIEASFFENSVNSMTIDSGGEANGKYLAVKYENFLELNVAANFAKTLHNNAYSSSADCFEFGDSTLKEYGLRWSDVVRQWMFLGKINMYEEFREKMTENYQMFNIARAQYYKQCSWINGFPSATGIGADIEGSFFEFTAVKSYPGIMIVPLRNPRQIDAHSYTEKYVPNHEQYEISDNKPKFERGKAVLHDGILELYVSGTAAILGEDSIPGDIVNQTETTIANIHRVASTNNLSQSGIELSGNIPVFSMARAYIKFAGDVEIVKKICSEKFGKIPITYLIANVCRKELLIEIEAYVSFRVGDSD